MLEGRDPEFVAVLESAARLQRLVPDAVLVGWSAEAVHAGHRLSLDRDHVLGDLAAEFEMILDALESDDGWATNRLVYGKVILGNLDGIEAGVRQNGFTHAVSADEVDADIANGPGQSSSSSASARRPASASPGRR